MTERGLDQTNNEDGLPLETRQFLEEQEREAEIQTVIDAAREIGLKNYTREDAIRALLQEEDHKEKDND